jgi:hypothetical protein
LPLQRLLRLLSELLPRSRPSLWLLLRRAWVLRPLLWPRCMLRLFLRWLMRLRELPLLRMGVAVAVAVVDGAAAYVRPGWSAA